MSLLLLRVFPSNICRSQKQKPFDHWTINWLSLANKGSSFSLYFAFLSFFPFSPCDKVYEIVKITFWRLNFEFIYLFHFSRFTFHVSFSFSQPIWKVQSDKIGFSVSSSYFVETNLCLDKWFPRKSGKWKLICFRFVFFAIKRLFFFGLNVFWWDSGVPLFSIVFHCYLIQLQFFKHWDIVVEEEGMEVFIFTVFCLLSALLVRCLLLS